MTKSSPTKTKLDLRYEYGKDGNVRYLNQTGTYSNNQNYSYDRLGRMTYAKGPWGTYAYQYDSVGNRVGTGISYGPYNQLMSDGTWSYTYDGNGNQWWKTKPEDTEYKYVFNSLDQLTEAIKWTCNRRTGWSSSTIGQYFYDANGARAKTVEGAATTEYMFMGHDPIFDKAGRMYGDYVYLNGRLVAKVVGFSGTSTHVFFSDALGSTRLVYNGTDQAFGVPSYKPFGTPYSASGSEKVRYAQEMQDASSTGLYYIFARYMDPELGRFISLDPKFGSAESPQGMNRYVYCVNNPLRFTDPTGELTQLVVAAIGGIYGAVSYVSEWLTACDASTSSGGTIVPFSPWEFLYDMAQGALVGWGISCIGLTIAAGGNVLGQTVVQVANAATGLILYGATEGVENLLESRYGQKGEATGGEFTLGLLFELVSDFLGTLVPWLDIGGLLDVAYAGIETGAWSEFGNKALDSLENILAGLSLSQSPPPVIEWTYENVQPPPYCPISGSYSGSYRPGGAGHIYYC